MMGLGCLRVGPVVLPLLTVLVSLHIPESALLGTCLSLGTNGLQQASLRVPLAYAVGPPPHSFARPIRPVKGGPPSRGPSRLFAADSRLPSGPYDRLRRLVDIKQQKVQRLQQQHASLNDPLQLRQHYVAHTHNGKVLEKLRVRADPGPLRRSIQSLHEASKDPTMQQQLVRQQQHFLKAIRSHEDPLQDAQSEGGPGASAEECMETLEMQDPDETLLGVVCDVKRCSRVTSKGSPHRLAFQDAADVVLPLAQAGADVLLVGTDSEAWGGSLEDLQQARRALTGAYGYPERPALVVKDIIIHPIQIAQAAEMGADGVYLIHCVAGGALEELLFAACTAGIEAMVEVHGAGEAREAVAAGATLVIANQADRLTGLVYPNSAVDVREAVSPEIIVAAKGGVSSLQEAKHFARCGIDSVVLGRALLRDDAFEFVRDLKRVRAGPRSLVHLFAGTEAAAEALRKAHEEEREARQENRKRLREQADPDGVEPNKRVSEGTLSPAALASLCAAPAAAGDAGPPLQGLSEGPNPDVGLATTAAQEAYGIVPGRREFGGSPENLPAPRSLSHPLPVKGNDADLAAIDASLKTRVVRVSGTSEGGEAHVGSPGGLRVFHSFDFPNSPNPEARKPPPSECISSSSSSRDSLSNDNKVEDGTASGELSDEALRVACEELLLAASERTPDGDESLGQYRPDVPSMLEGRSAPGSPSAALATPSELLPRKIYTRNAAGEVAETVIDPLAATVKDLDPKLVASLVEEARSDPKAFAVASQQHILQTWRQAEQVEALESRPRSTPQSAAPAKASPPLDSKLQHEPLLQRPLKPTEGEAELAPWATPPLPGASKEEVKGWLNDLELHRTASFFLTPEETKDFFRRLQTAAKELWGPDEAQGPSTKEAEINKGPGSLEKLEESQREGKRLQPEHQATGETSASTDAEMASTIDRVASAESTALPAGQKAEDTEVLEQLKDRSDSAGTPPGVGFTATVSPVSYKEWLLRPRGETAPQGDVDTMDEEKQTRMTLSRIGCVDAKPSLASVYDHMEPYIQYFQQQQNSQHETPSQHEKYKSPSLESFQEQAKRLNPAQGLDNQTNRSASSMQLRQGQLDIPMEFNEEIVRDFIPSPDMATQRSAGQEWVDSGGIELGEHEE